MDDFIFDTPIEIETLPYPEVSYRYSNESLATADIPKTVAPEILPYSNEGRNYVTNYVPPEIQATNTPVGVNFSEIGGTVFRSIDGIASIYGKVLSLDSQRQNMRLNRDITKNNVEIARIKSNGEVKVITAQQDGAINKAVKNAADAKNGGVFSNAGLQDNKASILIGLAGLGVAVYFGSRGKK